MVCALMYLLCFCKGRIFHNIRGYFAWSGEIIEYWEKIITPQRLHIFVDNARRLGVTGNHPYPFPVFQNIVFIGQVYCRFYEYCEK